MSCLKFMEKDKINNNTYTAELIGNSDLLAIDAYIKDKSVAHILKKLLRLSNALSHTSYTLLDGHIKDTLTKASLDINQYTVLVSNNQLKNFPNNKLETPETRIIPILIGVINLINSLLITNKISVINHETISSEISKIIAGINDFTQKYEAESTGNAEPSEFISRKLFNVSKTNLNRLNQKMDDRNLLKSTVGGRNGVRPQKRYLRRNQTSGIIKDNQNINQVSSTINMGIMDMSKPTNLNPRQAIILDILKDKDSLVIKDISQKITDCSEKTVQRELNYLVEIGLISRSGARRWTRYSIKHSTKHATTNILENPDTTTLVK